MERKRRKKKKKDKDGDVHKARGPLVLKSRLSLCLNPLLKSDFTDFYT